MLSARTVENTLRLAHEDNFDFGCFLAEKIAAIESIDTTYHALCPENNRILRVKTELQALENRFSNSTEKPPLFGVLLGVKDLFNAEGLETKAGSNLPAHLFSGPEATVVTKLKQAGALVLGKTVTTEFAYFEPGLTKNPRNPSHTPGGSSSGSAAAVALGYCQVALGTQTIGSISRPAAYCGVVGFKPSFGRIDSSGVVPFAPSFDTPGFFVNTLGDMDIIAKYCVDNWKSHMKSLGTRHLRLGIPSQGFLAQATEEVRTYFQRVLQLLKNQGQCVVETELFSNITEINSLHRQLAAAELACVHEKWHKDHQHLYKSRTKELIETGKKVSVQQIKDASDYRFILRDRIQKITSENQIDLWLSPASVDSAPQGLESTGSPLMNLPWTCAGVPTIALPYGLAENSMPLALQVASVYNNDEELLLKTVFLKDNFLI